MISESEEQPGYERRHEGRVGSDVTGYTMGRRKEKRRSRIFSQMFSSDVDEDTRSDVPIPSLPSYNIRSQSMVRLYLLVIWIAILYLSL